MIFCNVSSYIPLTPKTTQIFSKLKPHNFNFDPKKVDRQSILYNTYVFVYFIIYKLFKQNKWIYESIGIQI